MAEKKYSDMTEEEKKQWKKNHYKQQYELTKAKPVTAETATKNENAVYKPPTMTSEEAAEHTKKQNEIVKQNAEQEKRLMAGRTDPTLYNKPISAKAVSYTEKKKEENEALQNFNIGKANSQKSKAESDLEKSKANNRLSTVRAYKSPTKYNVNDAVTEVAVYKSPAANRKTEEERNLEREISNINRDITIAENAQKQQQTQENMLAEFAQDTGTSRINFIAEGKKKEDENNDPSITTVNGRQVRTYKSPQTYDTKKGENETRKRFLNNEEKNIYYYYLGKYGEDKANQFLDSIAEELNYRQAKAIYDGSENNLLNQYILGFGSGLAKSGENLQGAARMVTGSDKVQPISALDYASGMAREDLANTGLKLPEWAGGASLGQVGYDLLNTTGNMLPSLAVGALTGGAGGALAIGANSAGGAYDDAIREGYTPAQAANYAALTGASEAALGYVLGGIEATGGKVSNAIIQKLSPKIEGALKKAATKIGTQALSEFSEEYLQEVLSPVFRNIAFMEENEIDMLNPDAIYSGILGALNSAALNAPSTINNFVADRNNSIDTNIDTFEQETQSEPLTAPDSDFDTLGDNFVDTVQETQIETNNAPTKSFEERAEELYRQGKSWGEIGKTLQEEYLPDVPKKEVTKEARNYIRKSDFYGQMGVEVSNEQAVSPQMQDQLIANPIARSSVTYSDLGALGRQLYSNNANLNGAQNNISNTVNAQVANNVTRPLNVGAQNTNIGAQQINENVPITNANAQSINRKAQNANETIYVNENETQGTNESYFEQDGTEHPNTVGAKRNGNKFFSSIDKYGAQPLRKEQIAKDNYFEVPKKLSDDVVMSQNVGYMAGSALGNDAFMDDVILHPEKYAHQINTDAGSLKRAMTDLETKGLAENYGEWRNKIDNDKRIRKDDEIKAMTMALYYQQLAEKESNSTLKEEYANRARDIKVDLCVVAKDSGQTLQGIKVLQKLTGVNIKGDIANDNLYISQKLVEKLNERREKQKIFKGKEIVLDPELVEQAKDARGTENEGAAWDAVYKDIANQASTGFWQRYNNYRYWCMLSNPATHVRNSGANIIMATVNALKDAEKIPIEKLFNAALENKSKQAVKVDQKLAQLIKDNGSEKKIQKLEEKSKKLHEFDNLSSKTAAFYPTQTAKFAWNDFDNAKKMFDSETKYSSNTTADAFLRKYKTNSNSDFISTYLSKKVKDDTKVGKAIKTILEHGAFGSIMDLNSWLLSDVEDNSAKKFTYTHELAQRMAANNITPETANDIDNVATMDRLRAEAFEEALYNTFNQDNKLANRLTDLSRSSKVAHVATEALLPFKKVPLNIVTTGTDYSVIGLAKGIGEMAKILNNPAGKDISKAVNDLAKGFTGVSLMGIGAFLRSIGKITNGLSDDDDEKNFQKLAGEQAFALKLGDGSTYTIDWFGAPSMPLFSGAILYDTFTGELQDKINTKDENGDFSLEEAIKNYGLAGVSALLNVGTSIANPIVSMSMLENLEYALTTQYDSLGDVVVDFFGKYANQSVPQIFSSVAKFEDNTKRNAYYVDKTDNIPDIIQVPLQTAKSKIPGLTYDLPAQVDAWGREKKHSDRESTAGRFFDAFLSPGKYSTNKTTKQDELVSQLVKETGDTSLYPKGLTQKYVTMDKKNYPLSAKEYEQMAKEKGQKQYDLLGQLIANKNFNSLTPEEQAKTVKSAYEYSTAMSKDGFTAKDENNKTVSYEVGTAWQKVNEAEKDGLSNSNYLVLKSVNSKYDKSVDFADYLNKNNSLSDKDKFVAMDYLTSANIDNYRKFTTDFDEAFVFYSTVQDDTNKEGDIESLIGQGYSPAESLAKYNTAESKKKYENGEFKFGTSTKQKAKAETLAKKGYDPQTIVTAANAVTSMGKYGTKKNYSTCVKMLEAVGITDKKFQKDFWNYYVAT